MNFNTRTVWLEIFCNCEDQITPELAKEVVEDALGFNQVISGLSFSVLSNFVNGIDFDEIANLVNSE